MIEMPQMTAGLDLEPIEARVNATTKGPWIGEAMECNDLSELNGGGGVRSAEEWWVAKIEGDVEEAEANREFIAHIRTDAELLIAEVNRLREALIEWADGADSRPLGDKDIVLLAIIPRCNNCGSPRMDDDAGEGNGVRWCSAECYVDMSGRGE